VEVQEQQAWVWVSRSGQLAARRNGALLQVTRFDGMPTVVRLTFLQHGVEQQNLF